MERESHIEAADRKKVCTKMMDAVLHSRELFETISSETIKLKSVIAEDRRQDKSEAKIASDIERTIYRIFSAYDLEYAPEKEGKIRQIGEKTLNGERILIKSHRRYDARYANIITEYKKDITNNFEENVRQLEEYLLLTAESEGRKAEELHGVLTDGEHLAFLEYEEGERIRPHLKRLDVDGMFELVRLHFTGESGKKKIGGLVEEVAVENERSPVRALGRAFYKKLVADEACHYDRHWKNLFQLAGYNLSNQTAIRDRKRVLGRIFGIGEREIDETKALFSLQTAYAVLAKVLAYQILASNFLKRNEAIQFNKLGTYSDGELEAFLHQIESGGFFRSFGIENLLTADDYSWYLSKEGALEGALAEAVRSLMNLLGSYDVSRRRLENTHDFFNDLYLSVIPGEVRHSTGEYYTSGWLADSVISEAVAAYGKDGYRALDPCCGSGTFPMKVIGYVEKECHKRGLSQDETLKEILHRVVGMDINPLAVLTCRVNYFLCILKYLNVEKMTGFYGASSIKIPVFRRDAAIIPGRITVNSIECVRYEYDGVEYLLPSGKISDGQDVKKLTSFLSEGETYEAEQFLESKCANEEERNICRTFVDSLAATEGMAAENIISVMMYEEAGKFDMIVSNPPWIDWKAMPEGYREMLKRTCLEHHVFSGDTFTGGINLNICALICNVTANHWLRSGGVMGMLMPKALAFQKSYDGFRRLYMTDGGALHYLKMTDWSQAGNPFAPVTEKFMTYFFRKDSDKEPETDVPYVKYKKYAKASFEGAGSFKEAENAFQKIEGRAMILNQEANAFSLAEADEIAVLKKAGPLVGESAYTGRVGLGLYPKEVMLLTELSPLGGGIVSAEHYRSDKSIHAANLLWNRFETKFLYPVIESPNIKRFRIEGVKYYAPFPYTEADRKKPLSMDELSAQAPLLAQYYEQARLFMKKTDWNERLQGRKGEFYSITRVGKYTFAPCKVVFRNNTKWCACVVEGLYTPWGETKMPLLLDHACSIGQRPDGNFLSHEEAHYITAVLNAPYVTAYIERSSESRSFKTVFPIKVAEYQPENPLHKELSQLSEAAHKGEEGLKIYEKKINGMMDRYIDWVRKNV